MKKKRSKLLSGVMASTMILSMQSVAFASETVVEETAVTGRTSTAYDTFYGQHGANKAADVFYNGQALSFMDAFPLIEEGTTYVPLTVFSEAIGCDVSWNGETRVVTLSYKGDKIAFEVGESGYYVNDGERKELPFPTFETFDRTMVPVRFITDVFGLNLYWNPSSKQVIAADLDTLKEKIADNYQLMDGYLALTGGQEAGKNLELTGDVSLTAPVLGQNIPIEAVLKILSNEDASGVNYSLDGTMDLSGVKESLATMLQLFSAEPSSEEVIAQALAAFSTFDLQLLLDSDEMVMYLQTSVIDNLLPLMTVDGALSVEAGTWYKTDAGEYLSATDLTSLQGMLQQVSGTENVDSLEAFVEFYMNMSRHYDNHQIDFYGFLSGLVAMSEDSQFAQDGNRYTLEGTMAYGDRSAVVKLILDKDDLGAVVDSELVVTVGGFYDMVMKQSAEGAVTLDLVMQSEGKWTDLTGSFALAYTDSPALKVPTGGTVSDLTNIF